LTKATMAMAGTRIQSKMQRMVFMVMRCRYPLIIAHYMGRCELRIEVTG
jgi:hypothetical protein